MARKVVHNWLEVTLGGVSPQKAIGILTDIVNRTPIDDQQYLKIERYADDYGNPFEQNPAQCLRIVLDKPGK